MSAVFTGGKTQHFRRMLLGSSSQFFQQIGGCNAVIYSLPVLFNQSLGQDDFLSMVLGGVNMIVYSIFACMSWFLVERVGRRNLFLAGTIGQCLSMVLTFACLIPGTPEPANGAVSECSFTSPALARPGSHYHGYTQPRSPRSTPAPKRTPSQPVPTGYSIS